MKAKTLVKSYLDLVYNGQRFLEAKVELKDVVNEYFTLMVVDVLPAEEPNLLRLMVDAIDGDFNFISMYYVDVNPEELDHFIQMSKYNHKVTLKKIGPEFLKKFEMPEPEELDIDTECEECGEIHEIERLEGH